MQSNIEERLLLDELQPKVELSLLYKFLRMVPLFWLWFCLAAFYEITTHLIPELANQTHTQHEMIGKALSMPAAGHALGAVIGGLTVDRWFHNIDMLVAVVIALYIAVGIAVPYATSLGLLYTMLFVRGGVEAWLQMAGYRITMKTWRGQAAGPVHALLLGYSFGTVIAPQLVRPFLDHQLLGLVIRTGYISSCHNRGTRKLSSSISQTNETSDGGTTDTATRLASANYTSDFVTAYWILSAFMLVIAAVFVMYYIYGRVSGIYIHQPPVTNQKIAKLTFKGLFWPPVNRTVYGGLIVAVLFFYHAISIPLVRSFPKFIFSYAREGPCMSYIESTALQTGYLAALTLGMLCIMISSSAMHMKFILQIEVLGGLACALMLFLLHENITILWIFCSALGFFTGPIIPSVFAWANRYIEVTSMVQIAPQMGAAVGEISFLLGVGLSYQYYGPYVLWSYQLGLGVAICLVSWVLQTVGSRQGDRYS